MIFDHLMVTTDLSEASYQAFDIATYQAKATGAKITLLHIAPEFHLPAVVMRSFSDKEKVRQLREEYEREVREKVEELAKEKFHRMEVTADVIFSSGLPCEAIIKYTKDKLVTLIVMATQGRGGMKDLLLGTNTQRVIREVICPVMVIPVHN